jgi:hypothetical protein
MDQGTVVPVWQGWIRTCGSAAMARQVNVFYFYERNSDARLGKGFTCA